MKQFLLILLGLTLLVGIVFVCRAASWSDFFASIQSSVRAYSSHSKDYEQLYFRLIDVSEGPGFDEDFGALPTPVQDMYISVVLDMEIQNGGLCQFLVNDGGACAPLAADALRGVGLPEMAELLENFLTENGIDEAIMREYRESAVAANFENYAELSSRYPFDDFDDAYYALRERLDFEGHMLGQAAAHPDLS